MITCRLRLLCYALALLTWLDGGAVRRARAEDPADPVTTSPADADGDAGEDEFAIPPGDPWYSPPPQQRGPRPTAGDRLVFKSRISPHWFDGDDRFWYRNDGPGGAKEFILVVAVRGVRRPAFDHARLAGVLSKAAGQDYKADRLPFDEIDLVDGARTLRFRIGDATWKCSLESYECSKAGPDEARPSATSTGPASGDPAPRREQGRRPREGSDSPESSERLRSPDGKWTAFVKEHTVFLRTEGKTEDIRLSSDGKAGMSYGRISWSPDSKTLVAFRIEPRDRKDVYLIQSSPPGGGRARLRTRPYPLPGDKFTAYELNLFDVAEKTSVRPLVDRIDFGDPQLRWEDDQRHFTYEKIDRGHQRYRLIRADSHTGQASNLIDEKSATFIWTAHREAVGLRTVTWLDKSRELIYASERDGWRHLYLIDAITGTVKNAITSGSYVVRGIEHVDEAKRQVWFRASGKNPDQDPYFVHYYRVNFDGTDLVALTAGNGSHSVQFSPDRRYLIDTCSRVDMAPVHELRRGDDGALVCRLEEADISVLEAGGWRPPEVFVAKGRDGKTDIWGIICRPKDFDPTRKYPVIESIYAGPQGSFVPKTFSAARRFSSLTDLGFIVVQMDGMGTANRSKAFHDVCWHNIKDAGFPDRILWHKAAARKYPYYDLTRVGIYGVSAGGQNATAGVLFHPEFYLAAVSACGCHDNRMDKASWNEQWMGFPVGPWYSESSNVDNAKRLQGKLLLIVGEMDTNVPPESTMRVVDSLIKAGKDFEMLVVPNANHGMGGAYGERRMHDFFVRHLLNGRASTNPTSIASAQPNISIDLGDLADDGSELRGAIERYEADRSSLVRSAPAPGSPKRDERIRAFTTGWIDRLARLDFDHLGRDGQVDFLLFRNHLNHELRQLEIRDHERAEWEPMIPFARPILDLEAARRELKPMDWAKVAGDLNRLAKDIDESRQKLEREASSRERGQNPGADRAARGRAANRALASVEGLRNTLRTWFAFYDGYDPMFSWWMQEPYKVADQALQAHAGSLRQRYGASAAGAGGDSGFGGRRRGGGGGPGGGGPGGGPGGSGGGPGGGSGGGGPAVSNAGGDGPRTAASRDAEIVGTPIGREALLSELKYEMISYTPEELVDLARKELAWCEAEMKKASREMGLGDDWHAALERVKMLHVGPGEQPAMIRELALEAIAYLDANNLVTIPPLCRDSWRMTMMSPEQQLVNPFFLGGETIIVSYPTNAMSHEAKLMSMRGNNRHFSRATVHHELIPGHHLQGYMATRHKAYRRLFSTPFFVEGWSLYWELLLWDRGFAKSPENRVGMLFWRMHRCARIIFSLSFHLGTMTPRECIELLVDKVGHERDNATAEVRRSFNGSYGPLYQAAYLLGGMELRSLHRDLVESGKMTDRAFHDAILTQNSIPIEMIRAALTDVRLTPDYEPSWRFAGVTPGKEQAAAKE
jgi:dipeptidyl aminopeptidase/acylaminoacyl peptidase/uncharacterized protein (DUF885 family)